MVFPMMGEILYEAGNELAWVVFLPLFGHQMNVAHTTHAIKITLLKVLMYKTTLCGALLWYVFWIHDLWLQKRFSSLTNREQNCLESNKTDTILALGFQCVFLNNARL